MQLKTAAMFNHELKARALPREGIAQGLLFMIFR